MLTEGAEIDNCEQHARSDQCAEDGNEAKVPGFAGIKRKTAGEVHKASQSDDKRERCEGSVCGNGIVAELEEAWIQENFYR